MKNKVLLFGITALTSVASMPTADAAIVLSQNFDSDPVNYTLPPDDTRLPGAQNEPFRVDPGDASRYWGLSNMEGINLNPAITGNETTYLAVQNINNDGGSSFQFDPNTPAQVDFAVSVSGLTDLTLSVDLAGLPGAETDNFLRAVTDDDGDGVYESATPVFNFFGAGNLPYVDAVSGAMLSGEFANFTFALNAPTSADGLLRLRFEIFNDTNGFGEAVGADNIRIEGVPEPSSLAVLGGAVGMLGMMRRRRG